MATGAVVMVAGKSMGVTDRRARPSSVSTPGRLRKDFLARLPMGAEVRRRGCGCMGGLARDDGETPIGPAGSEITGRVRRSPRRASPGTQLRWDFDFRSSIKELS